MLNGTSVVLSGVYQSNYGYINIRTHAQIDIPNTNGELNGKEAMTWILYIRTNTKQTAPLVQYTGSSQNAGFTFGISDDRLFVYFHDVNYMPYHFISDFVIPTNNTWTLIGFTFNKMWSANDHIDLLQLPDSSTKPTSTTFGMDTSEVSLDAVGDIRIGRDDSDSFSGDITCIQFYDTSLLGRTLKETFDLCDPSLNSLPGKKTCNGKYSIN